MKLLNEIIADLLKEIEQEAEDAKFNKPGTTTRGGTDDPDDFCDECKVLGFCKNRYPERFEAHRKETLNKTNSMKKLYCTLLIITTAIFCSAQTTTYTDQYGNVIGTSTTTGGNDIFNTPPVRSASPPISPISDDALAAGYAARERLHQQRLAYFHEWDDYVGKLIRQLNECNHERAVYDADAV